jgi:TAP-like protein
MYAPEVWGGPNGFRALLDALADAALGDYSASKRALTARRAVLAEMDARRAREADYDNGFDAYYGNQSADTEYPGSFFGFRAIDLYARAGSRFGPYWWWGNNGCTAWPVAEDRYAGPWRVRTSAPVLVVGNFFDGVTDYAGARASSRLLENSRLLSYAVRAHGSCRADASACSGPSRAALADYPALRRVTEMARASGFEGGRARCNLQAECVSARSRSWSS